MRLLIVLGLVLVGCSEADTCADAVAHVRSCGGDATAAAAECTAQTADQIVALGCTDIVTQLDRYAFCWLDQQCVPSLSCVPTSSQLGEQHICQDRSTEVGALNTATWCGEWCDTDRDCTGGLSCKARPGETGMCLAAGHEPGPADWCI